jgi:hypothetical protein
MRTDRPFSRASKGGRLAEVWFLPEDQAAFDDFFAKSSAPATLEPADAR